FIAIVITSTAAGDVKPKCGTIFIRPGFGYDLPCRGPVAELADALDSKSSSERSVGSSPTRAIFFIYDFRFWVGRINPRPCFLHSTIGTPHPTIIAMDINLMVLNVGNSRLGIGVFAAGELVYVNHLPHAQRDDWNGALTEAWSHL